MNPFRHLDNVTMKDLLSDDWKPVYAAQRMVKEDLDNFER